MQLYDRSDLTVDPKNQDNVINCQYDVIVKIFEFTELITRQSHNWLWNYSNFCL